MALYNPMVMSKLIWTRNAARLNPFKTDSFLWIDGGHLCNNPIGITHTKFQFFNQFFDKMLISYAPPVGVTPSMRLGGVVFSLFVDPSTSTPSFPFHRCVTTAGTSTTCQRQRCMGLSTTNLMSTLARTWRR
jgi:hypothetical protein